MFSTIRSARIVNPPLSLQRLKRWLTPGMGVKRWLILITIGIFSLALGMAYMFSRLTGVETYIAGTPVSEVILLSVIFVASIGLIAVSFRGLSRTFLAPYRGDRQESVLEAVYSHRKRSHGFKVVAIGGGTGLPSVLRGLKQYPVQITSVVTVADDGGSSGRLRRELGVLPPGDLRNNIVALSDDESLMTRLFQYRFEGGELDGHAFGNLFITALSGVTGSIESALIETERVLNIKGRVLPATLDDVNLIAKIQLDNQLVQVEGESRITAAGGKIITIGLLPEHVIAYRESVQSILDADLVVLGPGSLFTSILPNLLVKGVAESLRATEAHIVYICNVATQPGETDQFTVADHIMAIERHVGRGLFQSVLANNHYSSVNAGITEYVQPAPLYHEVLQRYAIHYADLTDDDRPWRHDPIKLATGLFQITREKSRN
jgi:uncharacterized cofD-like protein